MTASRFGGEREIGDGDRTGRLQDDGGAQRYARVVPAAGGEGGLLARYEIQGPLRRRDRGGRLDRDARRRARCRW